MRIDGRKNNSIRKLKITKNFTKYAEGSVLAEMGDTKVIITASVEERVPPFRKGTGKGWITAEYSMLPRATSDRNQRNISKLKLDGRTSEIQRLIGRSLRAGIDVSKLGEYTIVVDCDVIQADGGTRTTCITGACVAVMDAFKKMQEKGLISEMPKHSLVAAVSVGIVNDELMLDLCYAEDSSADVDMNVVMDESGKLIEVQGTAEGRSYSKEELFAMLDLAQQGIEEIFKVVKKELV